MAKTVTTSLVVEFDTGDEDTNSILLAEIDSREDGLNNGNTSFKPGDPVYFLIYKTPDAVVDGIFVTHGVVNPSGSLSPRDLETNYAQFIADDSVNLTYPVKSNFAGEWLGDHGDLGTTQIINNAAIKLTEIPKESDGITPKEHYAGVLEYTYTTEYQAYLVQHTAIPNKDKYQIIIYIYGHTV